MNAEPTRPSPSISTEVSDPVSLPSFFTSLSSSLKPLRERNRTNLKRRINLSRSQVLSEDFENEDSLSNTNNTHKITTTSVTTSSQPLLTPNLRSHSEIYSKADSPKTPSPIHTTVTCSQVWERLASNEEHQSTTSPKSNTTATTSTSSLPRHISFSFDPSDNEDEGEDLPKDDKDDFQYVPVSSQSKLVQFQFLAFARQQYLDFNGDNEEKDNTIVGQNLSDSDEEDEDDVEQQEEPYQEEDEQEEQENRRSKKRKRSVSATNSLDDVPTNTATASNDTNTASSVAKPPRTKKPKIKDPNANFQRLNMRRKNFSHTKKHQFAKHKRNAFYRRMRYAGGNK